MWSEQTKNRRLDGRITPYVCYRCENGIQKNVHGQLLALLFLATLLVAL